LNPTSAASRVAQEVVVDYPKICEALLKKIAKHGGKVVTSARVTKLTPTGNGWVAVTTAGDFEVDSVANCAGLHCDRVSELAGEKCEVRIVPFRAEYYKLKPHASISCSI
jgi:(S)-2-hydroxyglutarate dehydrogenase